MDLSLYNIHFPKISDKLIKRFYDKKVKKGEIDVELYLQTAKQFEEAVDKGIGLDFQYNHSDNVMRAKLRSNLFAFSGAKSLSMFEQIRGELTNEDGTVRTFSEFKDKVLDIDLEYNTNWLRTEYNQAVVQSQHAKNWNKFVADKDLYPNLKYVTVGDDRVRNEHKALDGIVRPVKDSFWNTYAPQNGWGCRCSLEQMEEDAELTKIEEARGLGKSAKVGKFFKTNVGKTGIVIEDSHPYFINSKGLKNQLSAVENYGMKSIVDIYNKPAKLSKYKGVIKTEEDYEAWYNKQVKANPNKKKIGFIITSKTGQKVEFNEDFIEKKNPVTDKRYLFADEVTEVLTKPDEVWTLLSRNRNNVIVTNFIKYYQDHPFMVVVDPVGKKNAIYIKDYKKLVDPEAFRMGVLEYRK